MNPALIRPSQPGDATGAYYVCLKTGNFGADGEPFYPEDPEALGRLFVGPYLLYEPSYALILEDAEGVCGYALGALDSRRFYARYDSDWRPNLCRQFPDPSGKAANYTRVQQVYSWYHHPDYTCPEPYELYPSHLHIDLRERVQGRGFGRRMLEQVLDNLRRDGSPGAHLGVSLANPSAQKFYTKLGFKELIKVGEGTDGCLYMGRAF